MQHRPNTLFSMGEELTIFSSQNEDNDLFDDFDNFAIYGKLTVLGALLPSLLHLLTLRL